MSEWLTTGQMIDTLKIGQRAMALNRIKNECIHRTVNGFYWGDEETYTFGDVFGLNNVTVNFKWIILPEYVTFEEVKKAYEEGKTIVCDFKSALDLKTPCSGKFNKNKMDTEGRLSWYMITTGSWYIEE